MIKYSRHIISKNRVQLYLTILCICLFAYTGCGIYSFTGADYANLNTAVIKTFPNQASFINPTLSQEFTDKLKEKVSTQTNIDIVTSSGDVQFEGAITGYELRSVAAGGNDQAARNRLTITIKVEYINNVDPDKSFSTSFNNFEEFDKSLNLSDFEDEFVENIVNDLVDDIFNKAMVNW